MPLRLGEILVEKQLITGEQLEQAIREHQKTKEFLGQTFIRLGLISEEKLLKVLAAAGNGFFEFKGDLD